MVCPMGTVVAGVNTRTGATGLPETCVARVMAVKRDIVVPSTMATKLPVLLVPIITPALSVVAAAMVVD